MNSSFSNFLLDMDELSLLLKHVDNLGTTPDFLKIRLVTSKSIIVVSYGLLERFLKDVFEEFIMEINGLKIPKNCVNEKIWLTNRTNTLKALRLIEQKKSDSNYGRVVIDYSSYFKNDEKKNKPVLVKEAFSVMGADAGEKIIKNMFENIGIKNIFSMEFFNCRFDNVGLVQLKLGSFVQLRHSFAHGDQGVTVPSLTEVGDYLSFLKDFVFVLNKALDGDISKIHLKHLERCFKYF